MRFTNQRPTGLRSGRALGLNGSRPAISRFGVSPMALTLTPLGVTAGSPWRQPWGWESLIVPSPAGRQILRAEKRGKPRYRPIRG